MRFASTFAAGLSFVLFASFGVTALSQSREDAKAFGHGQTS